MGSITDLDLQKARLQNGSVDGNPRRYPDTGISILVVGGGVGGLMCALECWRKGHQVRIFERSKTENLLGEYSFRRG